MGPVHEDLHSVISGIAFLKLIVSRVSSVCIRKGNEVYWKIFVSHISLFNVDGVIMNTKH